VLKSAFFKVVGKLGRGSDVECRVSQRGVIYIRFDGHETEYSILGAVCHTTLNSVPKDEWYISRALDLQFRTVWGIGKAARLKLKNLKTRTQTETRKELFRLLKLPEERM